MSEYSMKVEHRGCPYDVDWVEDGEGYQVVTKFQDKDVTWQITLSLPPAPNSNLDDVTDYLARACIHHIARTSIDSFFDEAQRRAEEAEKERKAAELAKARMDFVVEIGLGQISAPPEALRDIKGEFQREGIWIELGPVPVSPVPADLIVDVLVHIDDLLAAAAIAHYAEPLFKAIDRTVEKGWNRIRVRFTKGKKNKSKLIERGNREEAISLIRQVLDELESENQNKTQGP